MPFASTASPASTPPKRPLSPSRLCLPPPHLPSIPCHQFHQFLARGHPVPPPAPTTPPMPTPSPPRSPRSPASPCPSAAPRRSPARSPSTAPSFRLLAILTPPTRSPPSPPPRSSPGSCPPRWRSSPLRSPCAEFTEPSINSAVFFAASADRNARFRTSSATTRKTLPRLSRPRRLHRRIERQQVRLKRDFVDHLDHLRRRPRRRLDLPDRPRTSAPSPCCPGPPPGALPATARWPAAPSPRSSAFHRRHLLQRRSRLLQRRRLLRRSLRQRLARPRQLPRRSRHLLRSVPNAPASRFNTRFVLRTIATPIPAAATAPATIPAIAPQVAIRTAAAMSWPPVAPCCCLSFSNAVAASV